MKYLIFIFVIHSAFASEFSPIIDEVEINESHDALEKDFLEIRNKHFPDLLDYRISLRFSKSKEYLMRTGFRFIDLFKPPHRRHYKIIVSLFYQNQMPGPDAIRAILVHELHHIRDYTQMTGGELLKFVVNYGLSPKKFVPCYERQTDYKTLMDGLGDGLLNFRYWQQEVMSEKLLKIKRINYFTTQEIETPDWEKSIGCAVPE